MIKIKKQYKNDIILILVFLLAAIVFYFCMPLFQASGSFVTVYVDGEKWGEYDLTVDAEYDLETFYGRNHLSIKNQKADVIDADCKDELCVHQKAIEKTGETIVCLPHKLVVEVKAGKERQIDGMAK